MSPSPLYVLRRWSRRGWLVAAALLLGARVAAAQAPAPPVEPLHEVLRDADHDSVPDRAGETVTTGGRVISRVIGHDSGWKDFYVQSGGVGIDVVIAAHIQAPAPGDSVVLVGVVTPEAGMVMLTDAWVRRVDVPRHVPEPFELTTRNERVLEARQGGLVTVEGTVVGVNRSEAGSDLLLYPDGMRVINVIVPAGRAGEFDLRGFSPGSRLRVTGILSQYDETDPYDEGYLLYPRMQEDLLPVGLSAAHYQRLLVGGLLLVFLAVTWALTLRRQVRQRTHALEESEEALREYTHELEEARDRAEAGARAKSVLLSNMSHELRTPLTAILGYSEVLLDEAGEDQQDLIKAIVRGGRRLQDTLNSVLDLAQIESGRVLLTARPVDVRSEAEEAVRFLHPLAEQKGIFLTVSGDPVWAMADRAALHRVLNNLVGNALKFTERGGVAVEAGTRDGRACLRITDTGIGIPPDFLPHLFEEFRQESEGYERTHEGNGLGLSITQRLVEIMEGTIEVESAPGVGSTFTVLLPAAPAGAPVEPDGVHAQMPHELA